MPMRRSPAEIPKGGTPFHECLHAYSTLKFFCKEFDLDYDTVRLIAKGSLAVDAAGPTADAIARACGGTTETALPREIYRYKMFEKVEQAPGYALLMERANGRSFDRYLADEGFSPGQISRICNVLIGNTALRPERKLIADVVKKLCPARSLRSVFPEDPYDRSYGIRLENHLHRETNLDIPAEEHFTMSIETSEEARRRLATALSYGGALENDVREEAVEEAVRAMRNRLGRADFDMLWQRVVEGRTLEEIKARCGLSLETIRTRVNAALKDIREHFAHYRGVLGAHEDDRLVP